MSKAVDSGMLVGSWALAICFGMLGVGCKSREPMTKPAASTPLVQTAPPAVVSHGPQQSAAATKIAPVGASRSLSAPGLCPSLCSHTLTHGCGTDLNECLTGCEEMLSMPVCQQELKTAYGCMAAQPKGNFECHEGMAVIKDGHCDAEQGAFAGCLQRLAQARK